MSAMSKLFLWSAPFILLSGVAIFFSSTLETLRNPSETVTDSNNLEKLTDCRNYPYKAHLFSEDPLVIYIDSFISKDEASQLESLR